jgi:hypothetical protein
MHSHKRRLPTYPFKHDIDLERERRVGSTSSCPPSAPKVGAEPPHRRFLGVGVVLERDELEARGEGDRSFNRLTDVAHELVDAVRTIGAIAGSQ